MVLKKLKGKLQIVNSTFLQFLLNFSSHFLLIIFPSFPFQKHSLKIPNMTGYGLNLETFGLSPGFIHSPKAHYDMLDSLLLLRRRRPSNLMNPYNLKTPNLHQLKISTSSTRFGTKTLSLSNLFHCVHYKLFKIKLHFSIPNFLCCTDMNWFVIL